MSCCRINLWRGVFRPSPPLPGQLIYGRRLCQPSSVTRCSFTFQFEIQSAFKSLCLAPHPQALPALGDICSPLLFFPRHVCLQARRQLRFCASLALDKACLASLLIVCRHSLPHLASCTSSSPVVWFLIWFSFFLFMLLKTYSWLLERVKMLWYHFPHTLFFCRESWLFDSVSWITKKEK